MFAPLRFSVAAAAAGCVTTALCALHRPAEATRAALHAVLRVVDADTGAPVVGAAVWSSVELGGNALEGVDVEPLPDSVTDEHGDARIDVARLAGLRPVELACLDVRAYVHHPDYITQWTYVSLSDRSTYDEELGGPLWLHRGRSIVGRVVDGAGAPVFDAEARAGVWSVAEGRYDVELESRCYLGDSDRGGHVSFDVDDAWAEGKASEAIEVFAWHPRYGVGSVRVPLGAAPFTLRLEPSDLRVRGRVSRSDGTPAGPERVQLWCAGQAAAPYVSVRTQLQLDSDGRFEFHLPRAGAWTLESRGRHDLEVPLAVAPPGSTEASSIVLPGAVARVRVVDEWGLPVRCGSPMLARVEPSDGGPRPRWPERLPDFSQLIVRATDWMLGEPLGGGVYSFPLREPGVYGVRASEGNEDGAWVGECVLHLEEGATVVDATLTLRWHLRAESVRIDVRAHDGVPLDAYRGVIVGAASGVEVTPFTQHGVPSRACLGSNYYELALDAGHYRVRVEVDGLAPIDSAFEIIPGQDNVIVLRAQR